MRARWLVALAVVIGCRSAPEPASVQTTTPVRSQRPHESTRERMVVSETHIAILDPIRFLTGSVTLDPRSTPILDAVASTLRGNPSIKLVAVHAYGGDTLRQFQARVAAERAQAVVDQLVARGIARSRLVADGRGTTRAYSVAFEILERGP